MARSKNKNRATAPIQKLSATPLTVARPVGLPKLSRLRAVTLMQYEDRRTFHPEPYTRPAFALPRSASRLVHSPNVNKPSQKPIKPTYPGSVPAGVSFAVPDRVAVCVRRKQRKEVIFALNKNRAGSGAKKRRRSSYSGVSC